MSETVLEKAIEDFVESESSNLDKEKGDENETGDPTVEETVESDNEGDRISRNSSKNKNVQIDEPEMADCLCGTNSEDFGCVSTREFFFFEIQGVLEKVTDLMWWPVPLIRLLAYLKWFTFFIYNLA